MEAKGFLRSTNLLFTAMFAGQLFMILVMVYVRSSFSISAEISDIYLLVVPAAAILAYYLGNKLYQIRISSISQSDALSEKLTTYRSAFILRLAFLEGAALIGIVLYYSGGNFLFILIAGLLLVYFYSLKPNIATIRSDAKLSSEEVEQIQE